MTGSPTLGHGRHAPVVVLSPHFDDALLGCWTLLGRRKQDIVVANVFSGRPTAGIRGDWDRATLLARRHRRVLDRLGLAATTVLRHDAAWHVARRAAEDAHALGALGREPVNLDLIDVQYRGKMGSTAPTPTPSDIVAALVARVPSASEVVLPAALGVPDSGAPAHVDHVLVRSVLPELAEFQGSVLLYADVPYACRAGWPDWVAGSAGSPAATTAWKQSFDEAGIDAGALVADVRALTPDDRREKLRALRAYRTQWPTFRRLDDELDFEVLWRVPDAAAAER